MNETTAQPSTTVDGPDTATAKPSVAQIWDWLDAVPDPEIPVISLVDLGIIRGVEWQGDTLEVAVTPTYSGCPATAIINLDIETALRDHGLDKITLKTQIAPPWTTDWMSEKGRAATGRRRPRALPQLPKQECDPCEPIWLHPL